MISGFQAADFKGFTAIYSAPEVLLSIAKINGTRESTPKTDTYSVGIVMYELLSRYEIWKTFDAKALVSGCLPDINFLRIRDQWKGLNFNVANSILNLLMDCVIQILNIEHLLIKRPSFCVN